VLPVIGCASLVAAIDPDDSMIADQYQSRCSQPMRQKATDRTLAATCTGAMSPWEWSARTRHPMTTRV